VSNFVVAIFVSSLSNRFIYISDVFVQAGFCCGSAGESVSVKRVIGGAAKGDVVSVITGFYDQKFSFADFHDLFLSYAVLIS
jgi:hypothetical protein